MSSLLVAFVLSLTAVSVLIMGILAAYGAVTGILFVFGHQSRKHPGESHLQLVASAARASGD